MKEIMEIMAETILCFIHLVSVEMVKLNWENGSIVQCLIIMKINSILQVVEINGIYYSLKHPIM